jgi:SAM-dependent methyltransferase
MQDIQPSARVGQTQRLKRVLNAGSGAQSAQPLHTVFARDVWQEIRIDIDAAAKPDVVGSITDMSAVFPPRSFDAVWSSHILEHLYVHQVPSALLEFMRILKPDGFALITSPDLEAIASFILEHGVDTVAYTAPAGPIAALDLLFGHSASIARGQIHMAHKSGFTCGLLGERLLDAGFHTVFTKRERFNLWAVALTVQADQNVILQQLRKAGLDMLDDAA